MSQNNKQIKTRIKSVKNTKKITKSMQLISAVKMQRTVKLLTKSKEYSNLADRFIEKIYIAEDESHQLLKFGDSDKELLVVITSNRGLCGSYNYNILKKLKEYIADKNVENLSAVAIGRKGAYTLKKKNIEVLSVYDKLIDNPNYEDARALTEELVNIFLTNKYHKVTLFYTKYISGFLNEAVFRTLIPLNFEEIDSVQKEREENSVEFEYEPDRGEILNYLLPKLIEIIFYQSILESAGSENSSRMIAMKNATDSADELTKTLTFELNKNRQREITKEVAEIVAGAQGIKLKNQNRS